VNRAKSVFLLALVVPVLGCSSSPSAARGTPDGATSVLDAGVSDAAVDAGPITTAVPLPDGPPGVGFDDLRWAPSIGKVLAPAGRTGNLDLVVPTTLAVESIGGFSRSETFTKGSHGSGTTSADEGGAAVFAIDHETRTIRVVDPASRAIIASAPALADPDYVRYVASTRELWLTEPLTGIEVFSTPAAGAPEHVATIAIAGGPEAIVFDPGRGRVYTNSFAGQTYAVDVASRNIVETWQNGCAISLGLALDAERGFVFVACAAGSVVVMDAAGGGKKLGELTQGAGLDILSYDPGLHHLYVQGATSGDLGIVGVSSAGEPSLLGVVRTAASSTSVTDEHRNVFVGDPEAGGLIRVRDTYPATP
jgi:hypothetical protein